MAGVVTHLMDPHHWGHDDRTSPLSLDLNQHCLSRQRWKTLQSFPSRLHWCHRGAVFPLELQVLLLMVPLQEREGRAGDVWVANGSVDGKCKGWSGIRSVEEDLTRHGKGPPLPAGFGLCWRKERAQSSFREEQLPGDALKRGGEEMAMKLDTWRGPSRSPAEGGITAGPGCNSVEILVPAKMFLGNELFSTARKGERTLGRGSADGASGIWDAEISRRENNSRRERI